MAFTIELINQNCSPFGIVGQFTPCFVWYHSVPMYTQPMAHTVCSNILAAKLVPIVRPSYLYGEYIPVLLWGIVWINELSDITLYDEICPHCTLHMMNWVPRRQNEASAVFVCRYVFRKWESPVQECGKCFKYTILQNSLESLKEIEVERTPETNNCREYVPCSENYKWVIFHVGCFFCLLGLSTNKLGHF